MAVATQNSPQGQRESYREDADFARLMSKNARVGGLYKTLSSAAEKIEAVLPDFMKGQAERLIARALMTFATRPELEGCPDETFRRIVVEAAELGFAVDGKLCYVVKYKNTYQLQLDYKAVIAVAKRNRTIKDIDAEVVFKGDHFKHGRFSSGDVLEHTFDCEADRGEAIAAYARVLLPDGSRNHLVMTRAQLDAVQRRAPAQNGPWKTDVDEMRKKTVIRRILKLYQDDPGLMRMLEITGWQDEEDDTPAKPQTIDELRQMISASFPKPQAGPPAAEPLAESYTELEPETHDRPQTDDYVDAGRVDRVRATLAECRDGEAIDSTVQALSAFGTEINDATWKAIDAAVAERRAELEKPQGKGKQTQKHLA